MSKYFYVAEKFDKLSNYGAACTNYLLDIFTSADPAIDSFVNLNFISWSLVWDSVFSENAAIEPVTITNLYESRHQVYLIAKAQFPKHIDIELWEKYLASIAEGCEFNANSIAGAYGDDFTSNDMWFFSYVLTGEKQGIESWIIEKRNQALTMRDAYMLSICDSHAIANMVSLG